MNAVLNFLTQRSVGCPLGLPGGFAAPKAEPKDGARSDLLGGSLNVSEKPTPKSNVYNV